MSHSPTVPQVASTLAAALADEVVRLGGIAAATAEIGISDDSVRRRLAGTHHWLDHDIARMVAAGLASQGSSLVLDRLNELARGAQPTGDARTVDADAAQALPSLLRTATDLADALRNRHVDADERRRLLADIDPTIQELNRLRASLLIAARSGK